MTNYSDFFYNTPLRQRYQEGKLPIIAGYCTVPDRERTIKMGNELKQNTIAMRGGINKPRTSPYSFQGLGEEGLRYLIETRELTGLQIVTEIMDPRDIDLFKEYDVDVWQIGSRNMQNFPLLREVGENRNGKPVLLKRCMCATPEEILGAIQYLGEGPVLFCLRGLQWPVHGPSLVNQAKCLAHQYEGSRYWIDVGHIKSIEDYLLDHDMTNVLVGYDPSHVAGVNELVRPIAVDAVRNGANFLLIETKLDDDEESNLKCDAEQAISVTQLKELIPELQEIYSSISR